MKFLSFFRPGRFSYSKSIQKSQCFTPNIEKQRDFERRVRQYAKELTITDAVERAITECIQEGILREFLEKNRAEARAVSIYEYNEEEHMRMEREEFFEKGRLAERENTERERKRADAAEAERERLRAELRKVN